MFFSYLSFGNDKGNQFWGLSDSICSLSSVFNSIKKQKTMLITNRTCTQIYVFTTSARFIKKYTARFLLNMKKANISPAITKYLLNLKYNPNVYSI